MTEKKSEIQSRELRVISDNASRNKEGAGWKFRVIQYFKDGKNVSVKLESGEYWAGDDGITRFKAKGLTLKDLEALEQIDAQTGKPIYLTVKGLMKTPPPVPAEGESSPEATAADPESVPFS